MDMLLCCLLMAGRHIAYYATSASKETVMKVYRCKVSRTDSPEFELIVPLAAGYALLDVLEQELSSDEFTKMSIVVSDIKIGSED